MKYTSEYISLKRSLHALANRLMEELWRILSLINDDRFDVNFKGFHEDCGLLGEKLARLASRC